MKKVLSLLKPFKWTLLASIFFATVNTAMQLLLPYYTRDMMSSILGYDMKAIVRCALIMLGFTLAGIVTSIANTYFSTKTSVGYSIELRNYIFNKVSHLSQSNIDKIGVSSLVTRTTNDVRQIHDIVLSTLKSILPIPIMLVGGLVMAYRMNPGVLKTALSFIPVMAGLAVVLIAIIIPLYSKIQKLVDKVNQIMREKISGIRVVRAFNRTEYEDERFDDTNKKLTGIALVAARSLAGLIPILTLFMYGLICVIMLKTINAVNLLDPVTQSEEIMNTIPNLSAFIAYFSLIITSVMSVVSILMSIPRASVSGKRIKAIMEAVPDVIEPESPVTPAEEDLGKVEFRNVSFKYKPKPPAKKKRFMSPKGASPAPKKENSNFMLENVSFVSRPGEMTAIIGITGSGKSTMLNLIPRLYDCTEGEVTVNGVNVKDQSSEALNSTIAVVPQQAFLFSGTIADNVRYGKPDASDSEIWRALEIAQAKSFVAAMPEGIESPVSQAGKNFSGGQKQRLAIARAVIKGAKIILFDDSFSALDLATDARLRASLRENLTDTNLIIVAQRVGTVLNADRIIVLDNGKVVGQGTHAELVKTCELYREIVVTQISEEALGEGANEEKATETDASEQKGGDDDE
ncbi:MAG: ABC transporter ATP-binding protein [Clostridia bacterium]|nr:ABC transporter ATP-binding protein [Clostridia bacterium]